MDKPNIQLHLISKDVQERQTLNPNLHLVGCLGDNCNVCGRAPSCARFLKMLMKSKHLKPTCICLVGGVTIAMNTHTCARFLKMFMKGKHIKPTCIEVEVGDNCVQFIKMLMKGKHLKPSCIVVEVEIKKR